MTRPAYSGADSVPAGTGREVTRGEQTRAPRR